LAFFVLAFLTKKEWQFAIDPVFEDFVLGHEIATTVNFAYVSPASILTLGLAYHCARLDQLPTKKNKRMAKVPWSGVFPCLASTLLYQAQAFLKLMR